MYEHDPKNCVNFDYVSIVLIRKQRKTNTFKGLGFFIQSIARNKWHLTPWSDAPSNLWPRIYRSTRNVITVEPFSVLHITGFSRDCQSHLKYFAVWYSNVWNEYCNNRKLADSSIYQITFISMSIWTVQQQPMGYMMFLSAGRYVVFLNKWGMFKSFRFTFVSLQDLKLDDMAKPLGIFLLCFLR